MSHSGNQGPDWYFRIFGGQNAKAGIRRFGILLLLVILALAALFWLVSA